jgi:hypothetical protein
MAFQERLGPARGENPMDGLAGNDSRNENNMQVTSSPRRLIVTSPKSTSVSSPGRWVCGKNTLTGPRPASTRIVGLRSAT